MKQVFWISQKLICFVSYAIFQKSFPLRYTLLWIQCALVLSKADLSALTPWKRFAAARKMRHCGNDTRVAARPAAMIPSSSNIYNLQGKFKRNKIFTKILFYGPWLSRGRAPPKFHDYMNSFCLCYFFLSDTTLSCLVIYSQSLLFSGPFVPLHRWQCFGYKQGLVWVLKRLKLENTCFLITIQAKFDAVVVEKWGNIEIR